VSNRKVQDHNGLYESLQYAGYFIIDWWESAKVPRLQEATPRTVYCTL
jgi:hypothetical protein